jgi:hypothetical protein
VPLCEPFDPDAAYLPPYYQPRVPSPEVPRTCDPIAIAQAFQLPFELAMAVKYLLRAGRKPDEPEVKDLIKALEVIQRRINGLRRG